MAPKDFKHAVAVQSLFLLQPPFVTGYAVTLLDYSPWGNQSADSVISAIRATATAQSNNPFMWDAGCGFKFDLGQYMQDPDRCGDAFVPESTVHRHIAQKCLTLVTEVQWNEVTPYVKTPLLTDL